MAKIKIYNKTFHISLLLNQNTLEWRLNLFTHLLPFLSLLLGGAAKSDAIGYSVNSAQTALMTSRMHGSYLSY